MRLPPLPLSYVALRGGTVASASVGVPSTFTASLNSTVMETFLPVPYSPPASGEKTRSTPAVVSIIMSDELESEPRPPGSGSPRSTAWLPAPHIAPRVCSAPVPA